ncbi:hypothetical protein CYMTET_52664 [Cymbomonas tetramitiformis]|uniref:YTH domain-containing protein n=1 Tax=Cymbomonas tetramitiformis TaxID=36881 RepID=A0AAE0BIU5_9CHLO|nr:hypothetical protein CYMTET_52664 [Cymbomonas tetramitiformis]
MVEGAPAETGDLTTLFEKATLSTEDHDANLQGSAEQNLGATFQASNTQGVQTQPILEFSNPYPPTEVMYTAGYNGMQQGVVNPPWQQPSPAVVYHDPAAVYTVPGIDGGVFSDAMPGYLLSEQYGYQPAARVGPDQDSFYQSVPIHHRGAVYPPAMYPGLSPFTSHAQVPGTSELPPGFPQPDGSGQVLPRPLERMQSSEPKVALPHGYGDRRAGPPPMSHQLPMGMTGTMTPMLVQGHLPTGFSHPAMVPMHPDAAMGMEAMPMMLPPRAQGGLAPPGRVPLAPHMLGRGLHRGLLGVGRDGMPLGGGRGVSTGVLHPVRGKGAGGGRGQGARGGKRKGSAGAEEMVGKARGAPRGASSGGGKGSTGSGSGSSDRTNLAEEMILQSRAAYNRDDFKGLEAGSRGRFFVIKSYSEDDIYKSIKHNVWSSTAKGNERLQAAFVEAAAAGEPVYLFFSVNASGRFCGCARMRPPTKGGSADARGRLCGCARMVSEVDLSKTAEYWQQNKWAGLFSVEWLIIKDIPNSQLRHIILENNDNKPVTNSRDTQEINSPQGALMLNQFVRYQSMTSILDDFEFRDHMPSAEPSPGAQLEAGSSEAEACTPTSSEPASTQPSC